MLAKILLTAIHSNEQFETISILLMGTEKVLFIKEVITDEQFPCARG